MEQIISKEELKRIMEVNEQARGIAIKGKMGFVLKTKGKEGLKRLEKEMEKLGYPIKYKELKPTDFYPIGYETLTLLATKKIFNLTEKEVMDIGVFVSKIPSIVRVFMKYFFSIKLMAREAPRMWKKYFTVGDLKVTEIEEEKKYAVMRLDNYFLHPIHCQFLKGYFLNAVQMTIASPVTCQETKCVHRGDEYHEFLVRW